jgi:flagellum-specific ATP synthase
VRELVSVYREAEDLITIGAYAKGSNPRIDRAVAKIDEINRFFRQEITELADFGDSFQKLKAIMQDS